MIRPTGVLSAVAICVCVAAASVALAHAETATVTTSTEPTKVACPVGYICFTIDEVGEIDRKLIELERLVAVSKARTKRFGWTLGCGPGARVELIGGQVEFNQNLIECGAKWGIRF